MAKAISMEVEKARQASPWLAFAPWMKAAMIAALALLLYAEIFPDLASDWWNDPGASQGMLILPLACYIGWLRRQVTLAVPATPSGWGLSVVLFACLVFLLGKLAVEYYMMRSSLVILIAGLTWTFWGAGRLRTLAFPLLLLETSIPPPALLYNAAAGPLQLFASRIATAVVESLGVSVFQDGNIIHLAGTSLGVAEACSGLHSLSALVVAALLLGYLLLSDVWAKVLLFAFSIPLAVAVNVLRVAGTALIADRHLELALGFYHSFSGWLIFVAGFGILWGMTKLLARCTGRGV